MYTIAILVLATFVAANINKVTYANFASHEANIASHGYDLSAWGYVGGQLPKVYRLGSNKTLDYRPKESYEEFKKIIAGTKNFTMTTEPAKIARTLTSAKQGSAIPRGKRACQMMVFQLEGNSPDCEYNFYSTCIDPSQCYHGHCPWTSVNVYYNDNSFVTFWQSSDCNGHHGSFNPICNTNSDQGCNLNFSPSSFGTKTDCHSNYANDGCS